MVFEKDVTELLLELVELGASRLCGIPRLSVRASSRLATLHVQFHLIRVLLLLSHVGFAFGSSELAVLLHRVVVRHLVTVTALFLFLLFQLLGPLAEASDSVDVDCEAVSLKSWLGLSAPGIRES